MRRFDSIVHVTRTGQWFDTAHDASLGRLLREMDEAEIERAVVVGLGGFIDGAEVLEACAAVPSRLLPCVGFDPMAHGSPDGAARALVELRDSPFVAIKLHPRLNGYDCLGAHCRAVLDELASWPSPLPVWIDTLLHGRKAPLSAGPVEALHDLAVSYPGLTFVMLHACGVDALRLAQAVRPCPNAYLDLSFTLHRYGDYSVMGDLRRFAGQFDQRLIWGSDFPEIDLPSSRREIEAFVAALPPAKQSAILGGNLQRILGLPS